MTPIVAIVAHNEGSFKTAIVVPAMKRILIAKTDAVADRPGFLAGVYEFDRQICQTASLEADKELVQDPAHVQVPGRFVHLVVVVVVRS